MCQHVPAPLAAAKASLHALSVAPPVAAVRPAFCPHCAAIGRQLDGTVVLEGNGLRTREVVVAVFDGGPRFVRVSCWSRRFLCRSCGKSTLVRPPGVLPGCLYSVGAIVAAWWSSWSLMRKEEHARTAVCAPEGADRPEGDKPRWRTPYRWASRLSGLFPGHLPLAGGWRQEVERALMMIGVQGRDFSPEGMAGHATRVHVRHGAVA